MYWYHLVLQRKKLRLVLITMNSNFCSASSGIMGPCAPHICMLHNGVALKKRLYLKASDRPYHICVRKRNYFLHASCQILQKWPGIWMHLVRTSGMVWLKSEIHLVKLWVTSQRKVDILWGVDMECNAELAWLPAGRDLFYVLKLHRLRKPVASIMNSKWKVTYWWLSQVLNHRYERIIKLFLFCYSSDEQLQELIYIISNNSPKQPHVGLQVSNISKVLVTTLTIPQAQDRSPCLSSSAFLSLGYSAP